MTGNGISMETGTNEEVDEEGEWISRMCYEHGLFCATHPRLVIFFTAVVVFVCSAPLFSLPLFGGSATIEWITLSSSGVSVADSRGKTSRILQGNDSTIPRWFVGDPLVYIQQFILMAHVSPWQAGLHSKTVIKEALKPAFQITNFITDFQHQHGSRTVNLKDVCLHVTSGPTITQHSGVRLEDQKYLPSKGCLLLSPANLWDRSMARFDQDPSVLDDLYQEHSRPSFNIALKEFIFGLPLKQTGIYPRAHANGQHHVIQYAVTLVLSSHNSRYIDELSKQLRHQFPLGFSFQKNDGFTMEPEKDNVVHIYYKGENRGLVELAPLCVTYFVVFLYLAFSVAKIAMVKSKWGLAFSAVITVVASLVMAAGVCSFFGLVTTLDSSEIFPYLVIVIGVENILVITKSVVSTPVHLEVKIRVAQGLSKEGWYIFKNLFTEMVILFSGYCTFIPAVQEFCLFAIVGLSTDFFLQIVFFVTVLSIDIRRMELSDLQKQMFQVQPQPFRGRSLSAGSQHGDSYSPATTPPPPVPSPSQSPEPVSFGGLMPPLPQESLNTQTTAPRECPVIPKKLPKRLNIAYFWARTRMVQKACMVCVVLYFLYVLSYTVLESADSSQLQANLGKKADTPLSSLDYRDTAKNKKTQGGEGQDSSSDHRKPRGGTVSIKPPPVELWRGLYQQHWPQLLNYYNVSPLGRYVTVLPPVHLGVNIDTELLFIPELSKGGSDELSDSQGFPSQDGSVRLDQGSGQETSSGDEETADPEYYLNALYCVVLGVVIMIVLFFVCKFLNDLQVSPRSRLGKKGTGHRCDELVESLPISLKGHRQNVEHVRVTVSSIVSVCLSGQICVWDIATGDCTRVINRNSPNMPDVPRERKPRRKKPKHRRSTDGDSGYTGYDKQLSPRPQSDSDCLLPQQPSTAAEDHGIPISSGSPSSPKHEPSQRDQTDETINDSILSGSPESSGYDFSKYAVNTSLPSRHSRVSSISSFTGSWSSAGDDVGWSSSSEASGEDLTNYETSSSQVTEKPAPSVWCVDCRGDLFVAGCSDGTVEIWSLSSGTHLYVSRDSHVGVTNVSFLSRSPRIVVARLDGTLEFLNVGHPSRPNLNVPTQESSPIRRSSPGSTRKNYTQLNDVPDATASTVVSPTGSYAYVFPETPLCSVTHRLRAHHQPISVLGLMEGRLVTGSQDRTLKVFRTDECVCVYTLHGHGDGITALTVDQTNNRQVVSGAANGGVRVWDVISGECLQHLRGHVKAVTEVTCTAAHLLSVSLESVLCIWDRSRGVCLHRLKQFPDLCSNVAMLSRTLFITGGQGRISVWDVPTGRRVRTVVLGNDDASVFVRHVHVCENATVVCDYGKELKVVSFPAVMDKAE